MDQDQLISQYHKVLSKINVEQYKFENDKYSGVFLPVAFEAYIDSVPKIMVVGRETAGWNTNNDKNTIKRIINKKDDGLLSDIIEESIKRYSWHFKTKPDGELKTKHRSHFQRYYYRVSKELGLSPDAMIYANLFAWDYDKKSPLNRPKEELSNITNLSLELLSIQIKFFKPDYIIFATGYRCIDPIIKKMFKEHFEEHDTVSVVPKKLWEFRAANATCFRIAHPRAQNGHANFRDEVIDRIRNYSQNKSHNLFTYYKSKI